MSRTTWRMSRNEARRFGPVVGMAVSTRRTLGGMSAVAVAAAAVAAAAASSLRRVSPTTSACLRREGGDDQVDLRVHVLGSAVPGGEVAVGQRRGQQPGRAVDGGAGCVDARRDDG